MEALISLIIIFFIFSRVKSKNQNSILSTTLEVLFEKENFQNISKETTNSNIIFVNASNRGENFLFAFKNNSFTYSTLDIDTIYEKAQKNHIHNIILLITSPLPQDILKKSSSYNIQIWDYKKLTSLAYSTESVSILQTSDTSDDNCEIHQNNVEAIQKPHSLLKTLFEKPTRL